MLCYVIVSLLVRFAAAASSTVVDSTQDERPTIVLSFDPNRGTGIDGPVVTNPRVAFRSLEARLRDSVLFWREGLRRMPRATLGVRSNSELPGGIAIALYSVPGLRSKWPAELLIPRDCRGDWAEDLGMTTTVVRLPKCGPRQADRK